MERSLFFWHELLGLRLLGRGTVEYEHLDRIVGLADTRIEWAELEVPGGGMVELFRYHRPAADRAISAVNSPGAVHICFEVVGLDGILARLHAAGVESMYPEAVEIPIGGWKGYRDVYVRDPDGVTVELTQRPAKP